MVASTLFFASVISISNGNSVEHLDDDALLQSRKIVEQVAMEQQAPQEVVNWCAQQCRAEGYCCNDPNVGSNQMISCAQACVMRAAGATKAAMDSHCDRKGNSGCSLVVAGSTYTFCQSCSDLTPSCPHGVQDKEECIFGANLAVPEYFLASGGENCDQACAHKSQACDAAAVVAAAESVDVCKAIIESLGGTPQHGGQYPDDNAGCTFHPGQEGWYQVMRKDAEPACDIVNADPHRQRVCACETTTTTTTTSFRTVPQHMVNWCAKKCRVKGYCCNDPNVGSNQMISCAQACVMRAAGATKEDMRSHCDRRGNSGCSLAVAGSTYSFCQSCSDLTPSCPHGVQDKKECNVGAKLNARFKRKVVGFSGLGSCHGQVRLGKGNRWTAWKDVDGEFPCTPDFFGGDPWPNQTKKCICQSERVAGR